MIKRFWSKVVKTTNNECWEWTACKNKLGYGNIGWKGKVELAHRVAWSLANGRWPKLCVLHSCDNPGCVNPAHLREGTDADNNRDMMERGRNVGYKTGSGNCNSKLTGDDVRGIRADERRHVDIAADYGVSSSSVSAIKRREIWLHI